jgi:hypothetical protein
MPPASRDIRTHWEAGVTLIYGEIGELLARLERLREDVPAVIEAGTRDLNTSIIAIVKATKGAQAVVSSLSDAQERRLVEVGKREQAELERSVRQILDEVTRAAAERSTLLVTRQTRSRWLLLLAMAVGLGLAGIAGGYLGARVALENQVGRVP